MTKRADIDEEVIHLGTGHVQQLTDKGRAKRRKIEIGFRPPKQRKTKTRRKK